MCLSILSPDGGAVGEVGKPLGGRPNWKKRTRTFGVCGRELDALS